MTARGALLAAALALAVTSPPAAAKPQLCSPGSCTSGASVELGDLLDEHPGAATVTVCVDTRCRTRPATVGVVIVPRGYRAGRMVRVRVTVHDAQGRRLLRVARRIGLVRRQPNGPGCSPVCFSTALRLDAARGKLIEL